MRASIGNVNDELVTELSVICIQHSRLRRNVNIVLTTDVIRFRQKTQFESSRGFLFGRSALWVVAISLVREGMTWM